MALTIDENGIINASGDDAATFTGVMMIGKPGKMYFDDFAPWDDEMAPPPEG